MVLIAEALRQNRTLHALMLGHNLFGDRGATALAEALQVNGSLRKVSLRPRFFVTPRFNFFAFLVPVLLGSLLRSPDWLKTMKKI